MQGGFGFWAKEGQYFTDTWFVLKAAEKGYEVGSLTHSQSDAVGLRLRLIRL